MLKRAIIIKLYSFCASVAIFYFVRIYVSYCKVTLHKLNEKSNANGEQTRRSHDYYERVICGNNLNAIDIINNKKNSINLKDFEKEAVSYSNIQDINKDNLGYLEKTSGNIYEDAIKICENLKKTIFFSINSSGYIIFLLKPSREIKMKIMDPIDTTFKNFPILDKNVTYFLKPKQLDTYISVISEASMIPSFFKDKAYLTNYVIGEYKEPIIIYFSKIITFYYFDKRYMEIFPLDFVNIYSAK